MSVTIFGSHFFQIGISVTIGGGTCTLPVVVDAGTSIVCSLPIGAGGSVRAVSVVSLGQSSVPSFLVTYALPTITQVIGCTSTANPIQIKDCNRLGGDPVTLIGTNFGGAGAIVCPIRWTHIRLTTPVYMCIAGVGWLVSRSECNAGLRYTTPQDRYLNAGRCGY